MSDINLRRNLIKYICDAPDEKISSIFKYVLSLCPEDDEDLDDDTKKELNRIKTEDDYVIF